MYLPTAQACSYWTKPSETRSNATDSTVKGVNAKKALLYDNLQIMLFQYVLQLLLYFIIFYYAGCACGRVLRAPRGFFKSKIFLSLCCLPYVFILLRWVLFSALTYAISPTHTPPLNQFLTPPPPWINRYRYMMELRQFEEAMEVFEQFQVSDE